MSKRKKIIAISSVVILICLTIFAAFYFLNRKIHADALDAPVVGYYGQVLWDDDSPAAGKIISVAGRESVIKGDGSYYIYLSKDDFDQGVVNSIDGAPVTFSDPTTFDKYFVSGADDLTWLPMPQSAGTTYSQYNFTLEKPILPNNFTITPTSPVVAGKVATFSFGFVNPTDVTIVITGLNGRAVKTVTQSFDSGAASGKNVVWDGTDSANRPSQPGKYTATITGSDYVNPVTTLSPISFTIK